MRPIVSIKGTGHYLPKNIISRDYFLESSLNGHDKTFQAQTVKTVERFEMVTGINTRTYRDTDETCSVLGLKAAKEAIVDAQIDSEDLDLIIFAHNWGDQVYINDEIKYDVLPNLASRIKHQLGIKKLNCSAFDISFGCSGFIEAVKIAESLMIVHNKKNALVIGADTVSSVIDFKDVNSMLFSDGAGAVILSKNEIALDHSHIIDSLTYSSCQEDHNYLTMESDSDHFKENSNLKLRMNGQKVFQTALSMAPLLVNELLRKSAVKPRHIDYILMHQANVKMVASIRNALVEQCGISPEVKLPMCVKDIGNNSVATVPILLSMLRNQELVINPPSKGQIGLLISFGAGMHMNALLYKF